MNPVARLAMWIGILFVAAAPAVASEPLRIAVFDVDASPAIGSPLAYDVTLEVTEPLSCRGVVLAGNGLPVVLCAVDWIGIGNDGQTEFRRLLAEAAGTTPERVAVHALHQHDAPRCDLSTERLLAHYGISDQFFDSALARDVMHRAARAVREATGRLQTVTHVGLGEAEVYKVASNRRILGPDGKVRFTRWTATADPEIRAQPVGTVDAQLKLVSFFNGDKPLAALTYFATHPQSYYRTGGANPDFPGIARNRRQRETGVPHVHFAGAGGDIGAGKWNDGARENRQILADRMADGMSRAWAALERHAITAADVGWDHLAVTLPVAEHLDEQRLRATLADADAPPSSRFSAANQLVWLRRCRAGDTVDVSCLRLGPARMLHMPGELFVEYQLAAQKLRPELFVAMAAYGDYAPGYIGTEIAYEQGGYETGPTASLVAPQVERVLMEVIEQLLDAQ